MNLHIYEPCGQRFAVALELLKEGLAFDFKNVTFCFESKQPHSLKVLSRSRFEPDQVTERGALADIEIGKRALTELMTKSADFKSLIEDHPLRFSVIFDYGTGAVELCHLVGDKLIWAKGSKFAS